MYKLFNWPFGIYLIFVVLLVMTWGLWDNGGPWYVPFTMLFLFFGFYCDFIELKSEMMSSKDDDNKCHCDQSKLSNKAKEWKVFGNDDNCYDCDKEYNEAQELIEMTQTMSEAFSCNEPGIS